MPLSRRQLLRASGAMLGAAPLSSLGNTLEQLASNAAGGSDYKALVGVFLYGGMDCHDTIIPYDESSYQRWAEIRAPLLTTYEGGRDRARLLPIGSASGSGVGREVALPPEFAGLHELYARGDAAVVANVGPLLAPTDYSAIAQGAVDLPRHLFSHNDQQATWMSGATEGARYGWAGRIADVLAPAYGFTPFNGVSTNGTSLLVTGEHTAPFTISSQGAASLPLIDRAQGGLRDLLTAHFSGDGFAGDSLLGQDLANMMAQSTAVNERYDLALQTSQPLQTTFPATGLGMQLASVAEALAIRSETGARRQVFAAGIGGFDTHDSQAIRLPLLQAEIDAALVAFMSALTELGLEQSVTLFTASDFGRTLTVNGDGTDHGWGGHHFVMGGAVRGGAVYGEVPEADLGHPLDAGSGRLIPGVGVAQLAASLGEWFGVPESDLEVLFPELSVLGVRLDLFG